MASSFRRAGRAIKRTPAHRGTRGEIYKVAYNLHRSSQGPMTTLRRCMVVSQTAQTPFRQPVTVKLNIIRAMDLTE
jgi:hypothetical protein